jgi:2-keto-4-pentenoate hydratase/2-oxohepta-3-ene-1,7-dioic acid hydratase in catechol pathway
MSNLKYDNGDLSDIGNEIGFSIGQSLKNMSQDEIDDFISGFKHGVSLTNGTH